MSRYRLATVAAKAVPNLVVSAAVPALAFLVGRRLVGFAGAVVIVVVWNVACQLVRRLTGRRWSALLLIGLVELVARTTLSLALHSAQAFFIVPCVVTALTGAAFVGSAFTATPLLVAVARDLVPDSVLDRGDIGLARTLRRGSVLYGGEQMLVAVVSAEMVLRLSTASYVVVHPLVSWLLVAVVVVVPAFASFRLERRNLAYRGELSLTTASLHLAPQASV